MSAPVIEVLDEHHRTLGEGPVWCPDTQRLFWIDIDEKKVFSYDFKSKQQREYTLAENIGSCACWKNEPNTILIATAAGFQKLDLSTGEQTTLVKRDSLESKPNGRFNDGKCDARGRLWAGTMDRSGDVNRKQGSLYCLGNDGKVTTHRRDISISNGIAWSHDNKTMYFVDSMEKNVLAFDFNLEKGTISNERVIIRLEEGSPAVFDGMAIDKEGMLWIALWDGACVRRYDPATGKILRQLDIPSQKVTSCCWGGSDMNTLFVTSADKGADRSKYPKAGCTFAVKNLGVGGDAMPTYRPIGAGVH